MLFEEVSLLLHRNGYPMTHEEERKLILLEENTQQMIKLIKRQHAEIEHLRGELMQKCEEVETHSQAINVAEAKNKTLLTARIIAADRSEAKEAKASLQRLISEIDQCIALLQTEQKG